MARLVAEKADLLPALGECFRDHGYEGASLARITEATGLGKGSLYHFFPGGKEEMLSTVLAEIDGWFEREVFAPLRTGQPGGALAMIDAVDAYFHSGRRVCLLGALALTDSRDRFAQAIKSYFERWVAALAQSLGESDDQQREAEEIVAVIQGAILLSRALNDPGVFTRSMDQLRRRLKGWG